MSRTNKKGARIMKEQQSKLSKIRTTSKKDYIKVTSLDMGTENGLLTQVINPIGNKYHWFTYGRKICWETGIKIDKDGYRYIKKFNIYLKIQPTGRQRKRLMS